MKSSKKYISEYICLKILTGEYKSGDLIYSENKLAIKFNCSRLTARSSLIMLVNIGVLTSYKGKGYIVSENALEMLFYAKKLYDEGESHKFSSVEKSIAKKITSSNDVVFSVKTIKNGKVLSFSFVCINKNLLNNYFDHEYNFEDDPIMKIINTGFVPNKIETTFEVSTDDILSEQEASELGYKNGMIPIIKQTMYDIDMNIPFIIYSINSSKKSIFNIDITLLIN